MKRWDHRFEVKPGRWVFVPTPMARAAGEKIQSSVAKAWPRPPFYFHLRQGGHVAALRRHVGNQYFFRCDLDDFFGRINRTRITRCLKQYFPYAEARQMADNSVVFRPGTAQTMLPYGYVQSPILASMALDQSRAGKFLRQCASNRNLKVSVYMDDIIFSSNDALLLSDVAEKLAQLSNDAGLPLSAVKKEGPSPMVTAFNVDLSHGSLVISKERIERFRVAYATTSSSHVADGILGYVRSVNPAQLPVVVF